MFEFFSDNIFLAALQLIALFVGWLLFVAMTASTITGAIYNARMSFMRRNQKRIQETQNELASSLNEIEKAMKEAEKNKKEDS